jgi:hypothetical protein
MKPYSKLDCPEQSIISNKVVEYLKCHSDFFEDRPFHLWNKVNTVTLLKAVPEISIFFKSIGLTIREISITVVNQYQDVGLHIDELPVTAKVNFPILNTKNTFNQWYEVPKVILQTQKPMINQFGTAYYNLQNVDLSKCKKIDEFELLQPVVFNSQIPHRIHITPDATLPRLVMPCTFFNEPIDWLLE